jgi:hypothetical protein
VNAVFSVLRAYPGIIEVLTYRVSEVDVVVFLYKVHKETVLGVLAQL